MLNFAPFLAGDVFGSILSYETITERVELVAPYTRGIRTYACYNGRDVIRIAHEMGLTTMAGAWVDAGGMLVADPVTGKSEAEKEVECLIELAREGVVDYAIVGSESIYWGGLSVDEITEFIEMFRTAVPDVPVSSAFKYETLTGNDPRTASIDPAGLFAAVDFVWVNFYPFWNGVHIDEGLATLKAQYAEVAALAGGRPVWISETGWPDAGAQPNGQAEANVENAVRYFDEVTSWTDANDIFLSWYGAFDEPGKDEGPSGVGPHWGIWDEYGALKEHYQPFFE